MERIQIAVVGAAVDLSLTTAGEERMRRFARSCRNATRVGPKEPTYTLLTARLAARLGGLVEAGEALVSGEVFGERILRCSDGHLYTTGPGSRLFGSIHLGARRYQRCPVDGKWRIARNAWAKDLTAEEIAQARRWRA